MGFKTNSSVEAEKTVRGHLRELRSRLVFCSLAFAVIAVGLYFIYEPILSILSATIGSNLYYSNPAGGFSFIMKICSTGALIFTIPIIVYNLIKFIKPAFNKILTTKRIALVSIFSTILAAAGAAFAFFIILPETINFFKEFEVGGLSALISADEYLSFVTGMIAVFAIIFQVPLLMLLADSIKNITPKSMLKMEKWVVVVSIVVAILTPFNYDILSSLIVAIPIICLYNLSIVLVILQHKHNLYNQESIVRAIIVKPSMEDDLDLNDLVYAQFEDELANLETVNRKQSERLKAAAQSSKPAIDFKRQNIQANDVQPAAWVEERKQRRLAFSAQVKVFSDISRTSQQIKQVMAS